MTKTLLTYTLCAFAACSAFAVVAPTEPTYKSAVIEEFTGIHCSNCPDGHRYAANLLHAAPDDVFVVSVHSGYFATPKKGEPNFITEQGEAIHDFFEVSSYPSAVVSRRNAGYGTVQGRATWGGSARTITRELSPVNLAVESHWDEFSRELTVEVAGYFTDNMNMPLLSVYLLQNNILGPQDGGRLGIEYPHRHMLRMMLSNSTFGDNLNQKNIGESFSKSYKVTIPESINDVKFIPYDMEILAFISEGQKEIVKAAKSIPSVTADNSTRKVIATHSPLIPISSTYGLDYLEMYLDNYSADETTSARFKVTLDGETRELDWSGSVPAHSSKLIKIPLNGWWKNCYDGDLIDYSIKMIKVNGEDPALEEARTSGTIRGLNHYPSELNLKIQTDFYAADNTYRIIDEDGNIIKSFGPYPDNEVQTYEESVSLTPGKVYGIEIYDAWGDGIYNPRGNVKIYDTNYELVGQFMEIQNYGLRSFFKVDDDSGISKPELYITITSEDYFDLTGRKLSVPESGVYLLKRTYSDGSVVITKQIFNQ